MIVPADIHDIDEVARTIYGEARGEPYEGKVAVGRVIINRWKSGGGLLTDVVNKPAQFSCRTKGDPNEAKLREVGYDDPALLECLSAATDALRMKDADDIVMGAKHYCTIGSRPNWIEGRHPTVIIGRHQYFSGVK